MSSEDRQPPKGRWFDPQHPLHRWHREVHARWPTLFQRVLDRQRTPLADGICTELLTALDGTLSRRAIRAGIEAWTEGNSYLRTVAMAAGQQRHGLHGPMGEVTPEQAEAASAELAARAEHQRAVAEGRAESRRGAAAGPSGAWADPDHPRGKFLAAAHARWPTLFPMAGGSPCLPLAIGVHVGIVAALMDTMDERAMGNALAGWTKGTAYLRVLAASEGQPRHGLDGPQGTVSPGDAKGARLALEARAARAVRGSTRMEANATATGDADSAQP